MAYEHPGFVPTDFIIFSLAIVISIGIGIFYAFSGGKQKTTAEYLVGNRQMSVIPVALSLMVSFESSIMMLGFPAEVYVYGIMFWLSNFGFGIAILMGVKIVVPLIHPLRIKSVYEYFELRYNGKAVRLLGTTIGMFHYVFYMGIVLFGPGTALEAVTNMPFWVSVICIGAAAVIYTSIGGIKAVIWTDVFQCLIMFMGVFSVLIRGTIFVGGPKKVFDINGDNGRLYLFNFDTDPKVRHTFWSLLLGSSFRLLSLTFNQSTVQRVSSMGTEKDARRFKHTVWEVEQKRHDRSGFLNDRREYSVLYLAAPAFFVTLSLATLEGVVAYAYYSTIGCDPLTAKYIKNPNQILPFMVLDIFRELPGMAGLFMAALFSASLSTLSSGLSSLSAMTVEDYIKPCFGNMSDKKLTIIAKLTVPVYGVIAVSISFMIANIRGPMSQIAVSILGAFVAPVCGLFLYSVFFPWATKKGALVGTVVSIMFTFWLGFGRSFSKSLKKTPWAKMPPIDSCYVNENTTLSNFTMTTDYSTLTRTSVLVDSEPQGVDKLYSLSYQWIGPLGIFSCIVVSIITSIVEGLPKSADVDVRYVLPYFDQFFPFLPRQLRKKLYFGVQFDKREELLKQVDKGTKDYEVELFPDKSHEIDLLPDKDHEEELLPEKEDVMSTSQKVDYLLSKNYDSNSQPKDYNKIKLEEGDEG